MTPNGTGQGEHHDPDAWAFMRRLEKKIEELERDIQRLDRIVERVVTKERK